MLRKTQIRALRGLIKSRKENTMDEMIVFENGNAVITKEVLDQIAVIDTQMKFYDTQYKILKEQLKEKMEEAGIVKIEMPDVDITYVGPTQRESLDSKALRAEEPEIYNKFIKKSDVKSSIRIKVK